MLKVIKGKGTICDKSTYRIRIYRSTLLVFGFPAVAQSVISCVFLGAVFDHFGVPVGHSCLLHAVVVVGSWVSGIGVGGCRWFLIVGCWCRWM